MQFSNRAQGFRNDKSQEISSTTAKSHAPVTQGVVGDKSSSINNIRDPEKKVDIVEEFPSWAGKGHPYMHRRRKYGRCSPNSLRPISYFGSCMF